MTGLVSGVKVFDHLLIHRDYSRVQIRQADGQWRNLRHDDHIDWLLDSDVEFRIKPQTITINGIEVPAPFKPEKGEQYFYLSDEYDGGYAEHKHDSCTIEIAAWRTKEDIEQVISALRNIFTNGI